MLRKELMLAACSAGVLAAVMAGTTVFEIARWASPVSPAAPPAVQNVQNPPFPVFPPILHEDHLTDWEGLSGGASPGAVPVKVIYVRKPIGAGL